MPNFKLHSRETIHVSGKSFIVSFEAGDGFYRAQARVKWRNEGMGETPLTTGSFKDLASAKKQIIGELERLLRGGEIQASFY